MLLQIIILLAGVSDSRQIWISKVDPIADESLKVQALVVKDEEVEAAIGCKATATRNNVRYSTKIHLMCAGSILTSRYILTTASCIHEATYVRHNIRAPLAVMISPFTDTAEIVRMADYSIHPRHSVDPSDAYYTLHNVAIAKLVCRISNRNFYKIKLPTQPFFDQCAEEDCKITIIKETGPMSYVMYEVSMDDISAVRKKRDLLVVSEINDRNKTLNEARLNNRDVVKVLESNESSVEDARDIDLGKRAHNENSRHIIKNNLKTTKSVDNGVTKISTTLHRNPKKRLFARESHDVYGCPQLGSALMSNKIQTAMVAVSCDDRQPERMLQYTDLFDNLDWINEMIGNWRPSPTLASSTMYIHNFFIDYVNCKNQRYHRKNQRLRSNSNGVKIPYQPTKCSLNFTDFGIPFAQNRFQSNDSQFAHQAYIEAINNLYLHKHSHTGETDNQNQYIPYLPKNELEQNSHRNVDKTVRLRLFSHSANSTPNNLNAAANHGRRNSKKTLVPEYKYNQDDLHSNYCKVKATYDNGYKSQASTNGNEYPERKDRDYESRYDHFKKSNVVTSNGKSVTRKKLFVDGMYEGDSIAEEFAQLYNKFLKEHRQSQEKLDENVTKRTQ